MSYFLRAFLLIFLMNGFARAEVDEKALRYHGMLRGKPDNEVLRERFFEAWIDSSSTAELQKFLEEKTAEGEAADWQVLSGFHEQLGKAANAGPILDEGLKKFPENTGLRFARAKLATRLLDFETALSDVKKLVKDGEADLEILKLQGTALIRSGRGDEAVEVWEEVLKQDPENDDLREDLMEILLIEGMQDEALTLARKLVERAGDPYQRALRQLRTAEIEIGAGKRDQGLKTYRAVIAASGEGTWLEREAVSKVELVFRRDDDARGYLDFLNELREDHPGRTSLRKVVARQKAKVGEIDEAVAMLREVVQVTPGDLANRGELIDLLEQEKRWEEAATELEALVAVQENDPAILQRLAVVQRELGDAEAVKKTLAKFRDLSRNEPAGIIKSADLYSGSDLPEEATRVLREGFQRFPESGELAKLLAARLAGEEQEDEAVKILQGIAKSGKREDVLSAARSLAGLGFGDEAFAVLQKAREGEDFEGDPLVLTQVCQLARTPELARAAVPAALELARQAMSPVDLQNAVQLAASTILRAGNLNEDLQKLGDLPSPSVGEICLQANLLAEVGEVAGGRELLKNTSDGDSDGTDLLAFYAVHFEQNYGLLGEAISLLDKLVTEPGHRKAVHLRRLAALHRQTGNLNSALKVVDDWRQLVPGDQQAWRERINLLQQLGRQGEAINDMRRMISKFGAEPEHRARLASALHQTSDFAGAERLYRKLYEAAESQQDKLKWVKSWTAVARDRGSLDQLKEEWSRRASRNPREVTPLLALAEVQVQQNDFEGVRQSLAEAVRRRPSNADLLADSASQLRSRGYLIPAIDLLTEALKHSQRQPGGAQKSSQARQMLVDLYFQVGRSDDAVRVLVENSPVDDPRKVEATASRLWTSGMTDESRNYLDGLRSKFPGDWRLGFLAVGQMDQSEDREKMIKLLRKLENASGEITLPTKSAASAPWNFPSFQYGTSAPTAEMTESEKWQLASQKSFLYAPRVLTTGSSFFPVTPATPHFFNGHSGYSFGSGTSHLFSSGYSGGLQLFPLPATSGESRRMASLVRLRILRPTGEGEPSEQFETALDETFERTGRAGADFLRAEFRPKQFLEQITTRFAEDRADVDSALILLNSPLLTQTDDHRELLHKAFSIIVRQRPTAISNHLQRVIATVPEEELNEWLAPVYEALPDQIRDHALQIIYRSRPMSKVVDEVPKPLDQIRPFQFNRGGNYTNFLHSGQLIIGPEPPTLDFVRERLLQRPPTPSNVHFFSQILTQDLSYRRGGKAVALLNQMAKAIQPGTAAQPVTPATSAHASLWLTHVAHQQTFLFPPVQQHQGHSFNHPQFPTPSIHGFMINQLFVADQNSKLTLAQKARRDELLKEISSGENPISKQVTTSDYLSVWRPHLSEIENPVFRALALFWSAEREALQKLVSELAKSDKVDELRIAAAGLHLEGKHLECSQALARAHSLAQSKILKTELGRQLAVVALDLEPTGRRQVDLEPAVSSLLALAKLLPDSSIVDKLRGLGYAAEADQVNLLMQQKQKMQTRIRQRSSRSANRQAGRNSFPQRLNRAIASKKSDEGNEGADAVKLVVEAFRRAIPQISNQRSHGNRQRNLVNAIGQLGKAGLDGDFFDAIHPDDEAPPVEKKAYGRLMLQLQLSRTKVAIPTEKAAAVFESLWQDDPLDWELVSGLIILQPAKFDDWQKLWEVPTVQKNPNTLQSIIGQLTRRGGASLAGFEFAFRLSDRLLRGEHLGREISEMSEEERINQLHSLYWIQEILNTLQRTEVFAEGRARELKNDRSDPKEVDEEIQKKAFGLTRKFSELLLEYPIHSRAAFSVLLAAREELQLEEGEIDSAANKVLFPLVSSEIWGDTLLTAQIHPSLNWLLQREKETGRQVISRENLEVWEENNPVKYGEYLTSQKLALASGPESEKIYRHWLAELPEIPSVPPPDEQVANEEGKEDPRLLRRRRADALTYFYQALYRSVNSELGSSLAWWPDHGKLLLGSEFQYNSLAQSWLKFLVREGRGEDFAGFFDEWVLRVLGPRKKWSALVELAQMEALPPQLQQRASQFQNQLGTIMSQPAPLVMIEKVAAAIFARGLSPLVRQPMNEFGQKVQNDLQSREGILEDLVKIYPADSVKIHRVLLLSEALESRRSQIGREQAQEFRKELSKKKELDPLVALFFKYQVPLRSEWNVSPPVVFDETPEVLAASLDQLREGLEKWPTETRRLIAKWVPGYQLEKADPGLKKLLAECREREQVELGASLRELALRWGATPGPQSGSRDRSNDWELFNRVMALDPSEAARCAEMIIGNLRESTTAAGRMQVFEKFFSHLIYGTANRSNLTSNEDWIILIDQLWHGEHREFVPHFDTSWTYPENRLFPAIEVDGEWKPRRPRDLALPEFLNLLEPQLARLTERQRLTFSCFVSDFMKTGSAVKSDQLAAQIEILDGDFRDRYPFLADLMIAFTIGTNRVDKTSEEHQAKAVECLNRFLGSDEVRGLPFSLQDRLARTLLGRAGTKSLISKAGQWGWFMDLLKRSQKANPHRFNRGQVEHSWTQQIPINSLPGILEKVPGADEILFNFVGRNLAKDQFSIAGSLLKPLIETGRADLALELVKMRPDRFDNDVILYWSLWKSGHQEEVKKLISREGVTFEMQNQYRLSAERSDEFSAFVNSFPPETAFWISHRLLDLPPPLGYKGEENRTDKLRELARRYADEAPRDHESRIQILVSFLADPEATSLAMPEIQKTVRNKDAIALLLDGQMHSHLIGIFHAVHDFEVESGDFENLIGQLEAFLEEPAFEGHSDTDQVGNFYPGLLAPLLAKATESAESAREILPVARELLTRAEENEDHLPEFLRAQTWSFAMFVHLLAGAEDGWAGHPSAGFPMKEESDKVGDRWKNFFPASVASIARGNGFLRADRQEARLSLGRAYLESDWVQQRLQKLSADDLRPLINAFTVPQTPDRIRRFRDSLPPDLPCAYLYEWRSVLAIFALRGDPRSARPTDKELDELTNGLEKALNLAVAREGQHLADVIRGDLFWAYSRGKDPAKGISTYQLIDQNNLSPDAQKFLARVVKEFNTYFPDHQIEANAPTESPTKLETPKEVEVPDISKQK